jgi:hypothetical protein
MLRIWISEAWISAVAEGAATEGAEWIGEYREAAGAVAQAELAQSIFDIGQGTLALKTLATAANI